MVAILGQSTGQDSQTIQDKWNEYRGRTAPSGASTRQIIDMRNAFYSGAHAVLLLQAQLSHLQGDTYDDRMKGYLQEILHDLTRKQPIVE